MGANETCAAREPVKLFRWLTSRANNSVFVEVTPGMRLEGARDLRDLSGKGCPMSIGVSIFLLVVGAILTFAVNVSSPGFNINAVGIILMVAGALGLLWSLIFWSSFSPWTRRRRPMIDTVYDGGTNHIVEERRVERDLP
jgi:Domain of unknown function (DUF6458)